jgi:hypothetical protein
MQDKIMFVIDTTDPKILEKLGKEMAGNPRATHIEFIWVVNPEAPGLKTLRIPESIANDFIKHLKNNLALEFITFQDCFVDDLQWKEIKQQLEINAEIKKLLSSQPAPNNSAAAAAAPLDANAEALKLSPLLSRDEIKTLSFKNCAITDDEASSIAEQISYADTWINLEIIDCDISTPGYNAILGAIANSDKVVELSISLPKIYIGHDPLIRVAPENKPARLTDVLQANNNLRTFSLLPYKSELELKELIDQGFFAALNANKKLQTINLYPLFHMFKKFVNNHPDFKFFSETSASKILINGRINVNALTAIQTDLMSNPNLRSIRFAEDSEFLDEEEDIVRANGVSALPTIRMQEVLKPLTGSFIQGENHCSFELALIRKLHDFLMKNQNKAEQQFKLVDSRLEQLENQLKEAVFDTSDLKKDVSTKTCFLLSNETQKEQFLQKLNSLKSSIAMEQQNPAKIGEVFHTLVPSLAMKDKQAAESLILIISGFGPEILDSENKNKLILYIAYRVGLDGHPLVLETWKAFHGFPMGSSANFPSDHPLINFATLSSIGATIKDDIKSGKIKISRELAEQYNLVVDLYNTQSISSLTYFIFLRAFPPIQTALKTKYGTDRIIHLGEALFRNSVESCKTYYESSKALPTWDELYSAIQSQITERSGKEQPIDTFELDFQEFLRDGRIMIGSLIISFPSEKKEAIATQLQLLNDDQDVVDSPELAFSRAEMCCEREGFEQVVAKHYLFACGENSQEVDSAKALAYLQELAKNNMDSLVSAFVEFYFASFQRKMESSKEETVWAKIVIILQLIPKLENALHQKANTDSKIYLMLAKITEVTGHDPVQMYKDAKPEGEQHKSASRTVKESFIQYACQHPQQFAEYRWTILIGKKSAPLLFVINTSKLAVQKNGPNPVGHPTDAFSFVKDQFKSILIRYKNASRWLAFGKSHQCLVENILHLMGMLEKLPNKDKGMILSIALLDAFKDFLYYKHPNSKDLLPSLRVFHQDSVFFKEFSNNFQHLIVSITGTFDRGHTHDPVNAPAFKLSTDYPNIEKVDLTKLDQKLIQDWINKLDEKWLKQKDYVLTQSIATEAGPAAAATATAGPNPSSGGK